MDREQGIKCNKSGKQEIVGKGERERQRERRI